MTKKCVLVVLSHDEILFGSLPHLPHHGEVEDLGGFCLRPWRGPDCIHPALVRLRVRGGECKAEGGHGLHARSGQHAARVRNRTYEERCNPVVPHICEGQHRGGTDDPRIGRVLV